MITFNKYLKSSSAILYLSIVLLPFLASCSKDKGTKVNLLPFCDTIPAKFQNDIIPVIVTHCSNPPFASCHSWATDHSVLKVYIDNGSFQNRVFVHQDMPPPNNIENVPPLSDLELKKLQCWIYQGAPNN